MIIKTDEDWRIVLDRLLSGPVGLICDNFRVLLMNVIDVEAWKTYIKPIVNGVYFPAGWEWIGCDEYYHACDIIYTPLYYEKRKYIYNQSQRKYWKRKLSKSAYKKGGYNRYLYRYTDFPSFKTLKRQYVKTFEHIELFEKSADAFIDNTRALPGSVGNTLRGTGKALPEVIEGEVIDD